jgi:imidazole glycerol-phosphate synthase subunit HisH
MRLTLFDYGAGNLHSLAKALARAGRTVRIEPDPRAALDTDVLVLPGVGAFAPAAARLAPARAAMRDAILAGLPTLGICLGMQLLLDASDEGPGAGLGVLAGRVTALRAARTPQMGWNTLDDVRDPALERAGLGVAYYANRYACRVADADAVVAWSTHEGDRFPAAVRRGPVLGVQFHPEKSSAPGLRFLDSYLDSL